MCAVSTRSGDFQCPAIVKVVSNGAAYSDDAYHFIAVIYCYTEFPALGRQVVAVM